MIMTAMGGLILVLEDEAIVGLDIDLSLSEAGFTVLLANSCFEAEKIIADQRPDLAILDVQLRDGESVGVTKALVDKGVPFIVHTGSRLNELDGIFQSGILVAKPSDTNAMVELAKSMVERATA